MMLAAAIPVSSSTRAESSRPAPGSGNPSQLSGRQGGGSSSSVRSMLDTIRSNTQSVNASGTQISRPVIRYFFSIVVGFSRRSAASSTPSLGAAGKSPRAARPVVGRCKI